MKKKTRKPYKKPRMRVKRFDTFFFVCACAHGPTACAPLTTDKAVGDCF